MRSYTDEHGVTAWIFDEYTHPKGLYYGKKEEVVEKVSAAPAPAPVVEAPSMSKKLFGKKK